MKVSLKVVLQIV